MKRRVVYLADDEWEWARKFARDNLFTASEVVRKALAEFRGMENGVAPDEFVPIARIRELEEEVRHLKAELAKRPHVFENMGGRSRAEPVQFNTRPFTPVPKKGK